MASEVKPSLVLGHTTACPVCASTSIIVDTSAGEVLCKMCGAVLNESVPTLAPEWRNFGDNDNSRAGLPYTLLSCDKGLSTTISPLYKDANGKAISAEEVELINRIRLLDKRANMQDSTNRSLQKGLRELEKIADKLGVSKTILEQAAWIYRKVLKEGFTRGRPIQATAAAALYAACRDLDTPRTIKDFAAITNVPKKELARCYRKLLSVIDLQLPIVDLMKCVSRVAASVGFGERAKRRAIEIVKLAQSSGNVTGKDPMGTAAAVLYIAGTLEGERVRQKDLAKAAGVTEVTIRNRCRSLKGFVRINGL
ncbi:MAG: transcription initiation factor IIB [Nitrososphaerales archaeon]